MVLLLVAVVAVHFLSSSRLDKRWDLPAETVAVSTDSATIAHGAHVATLLGCDGCHGPDLSGRIFLNAPGIGRIWARNLTPGEGGAGAAYTDADWVRAIRHAVAPDGRGLYFMPSQNYQRLNDHDLGALVAWLRSLPAVDAVHPPNELELLGRFLYLRGSLPLVTAEQLNHDAPRPASVPIGPTAAYGEYLAGGCRGCHGETFSGGAIPGGPTMLPSRNLTPDSASGIGRWSFEDFRIAMRFGQLPQGVIMDSVAMPLAMSREFTDDELTALYTYFMSLPAKPYGNR